MQRKVLEDSFVFLTIGSCKYLDFATVVQSAAAGLQTRQNVLRTPSHCHTFAAFIETLKHVCDLRDSPSTYIASEVSHRCFCEQTCKFAGHSSFFRRPGRRPQSHKDLCPRVSGSNACFTYATEADMRF